MTVYVSAIMWYKVKDATSAIANVDDYSGSAKLLAATTLRNVLGTRNLGDILSERESIAQEMESCLDEATDPWGVQVERVEVKDVRVPENLQRAMAAEAEAARNARAKVIAAEGEHKSSRALRHAAEVITDSPAALQVTHHRSQIARYNYLNCSMKVVYYIFTSTPGVVRTHFQTNPRIQVFGENQFFLFCGAPKNFF